MARKKEHRTGSRNKTGFIYLFIYLFTSLVSLKMKIQKNINLSTSTLNKTNLV